MQTRLRSGVRALGRRPSNTTLLMAMTGVALGAFEGAVLYQANAGAPAVGGFRVFDIRRDAGVFFVPAGYWCGIAGVVLAGAQWRSRARGGPAESRGDRADGRSELPELLVAALFVTVATYVSGLLFLTLATVLVYGQPSGSVTLAAISLAALRAYAVCAFAALAANRLLVLAGDAVVVGLLLFLYLAVVQPLATSVGMRWAVLSDDLAVWSAWREPSLAPVAVTADYVTYGALTPALLLLVLVAAAHVAQHSYARH